MIRIVAMAKVLHSTNCFNTLIRVAEDCPAQRGEVVHALMPSPSLSGVFARAASGARLRGTPTGLNAALASARRATAACNEPRG